MLNLLVYCSVPCVENVYVNDALAMNTLAKMSWACAIQRERERERERERKKERERESNAWDSHRPPCQNHTASSTQAVGKSFPFNFWQILAV